MKNVIKLEELGMFLLSVFLFGLLGMPWWIFLILILTPDISMLAYKFGDKAGAFVYNLFHHKGIAIIIYLLGTASFNSSLMLAGIIMFGHSSMDRLFGFGLKYGDSFKHTHLGSIGK